MKRLAAACAIFFLSACATLSEEECLAGNWRAIGFEDGAQGQPPDRVGDHRRACEAHGVTPDLELWRIGYDEGLTRYCTRPNGFRVGAEGTTYHGVCTGPFGAAFLAAYQDGRALYTAKNELDGVLYDLNSVEHDLGEAHDEREELRTRLDEDALSDAERRDLTDRVEHLSERIGELRGRRRVLSSEAADLEYAFDDLAAALSAVYPEWSGY